MFFFFSIFLTNFYLYLYGLVINKYFFKYLKVSKAEIAIMGCIFVSFVAVLTNFFIPLSKFVNTLFFLIPFFFILTKKFIFKKDIVFIIATSIFTCILIAYSNVNTPDAGLYHLPYIKILNESKIIAGLSNIHSRFGHISVVQYLSAINFNYIFGVYGILVPLASLMCFIFFYFLNEVVNFIKKNEQLKINSLFCLFVTCYISYKINRYSGFGNDAIAHLLFFYLISIFLKSTNNYISLDKTSIISTFIFLNKVTLILAFIFPIILFFQSKKKNKIFYSFGTIFLLIWLVKNIVTSSCLVFPLEKTCINGLPWSNKNEVIKQNILGEAWAKGWPDRTNKEISQRDFNKKFNWVSTWSEVHLKYILKILLPYLVILSILVFLINFLTKDKLIKFNFLDEEKFKFYSTIIILFIGCSIFFFKFPLYRYGYSYLISLLIFIFIIAVFKYEKFKTTKIFKYTLIICFIVIISKQLIRIQESYKNKSIWPNIYSSNLLSEKNNSVKINIGNNFKIYVKKTECFYSKSPCTNNYNDNIFHKKIAGYSIIYLRN